MKRLKPYHVFWIPIPAIMCICALMPSEFRLFAYTNYYSFNSLQFGIYLSIFLFLSGVGYFFIRKSALNAKMYKSHLKYTVVGSLICITTFIFIYLKNKHIAYAAESDDQIISGLDQLLVLLFMLGTLILFIGFMIYTTYVLITMFFGDKIEAK